MCVGGVGSHGLSWDHLSTVAGKQLPYYDEELLNDRKKNAFPSVPVLINFTVTLFN